ncbi:MAG: prepilin peptidase [Lachnospiraceae bacterium]|nr:prepilin peptidase [Lachnospiraceae bacterium]
MSAVCFFALFFASAAMICDLQTGRIPNSLILTGWGIGGVFGLVRTLNASGSLPMMFAGALLPLLITAPLFLMRMTGAGDSKLFSVIGIFCGPEVLKIMLASVVCGGLLSLLLMLSVTGVRERLLYFAHYVQTGGRERRTESGAGQPGIRAYRTGGAERPENMHFSVAVFMAAALYAGGVI